MKKLSLFVLLLICIRTTAFSQDFGVKSKEINFGIFTETVLSKDTLSKSSLGKINAARGGQIIKRTNKIPAKIGIQFAVQGKVISNTEQKIPLEVTWVFPEGMKDKDGNPMPKWSYQTKRQANTVGSFAYGIDGRNEAVKGKWVLILKQNNKEIYRKQFILQ